MALTFATTVVLAVAFVFAVTLVFAMALRVYPSRAPGRQWEGRTGIPIEMS